MLLFPSAAAGTPANAVENSKNEGIDAALAAEYADAVSLTSVHTPPEDDAGIDTAHTTGCPV
jgi:hypothetical protein